MRDATLCPLLAIATSSCWSIQEKGYIFPDEECAKFTSLATQCHAKLTCPKEAEELKTCQADNKGENQCQDRFEALERCQKAKSNVTAAEGSLASAMKVACGGRFGRWGECLFWHKDDASPTKRCKRFEEGFGNCERYTLCPSESQQLASCLKSGGSTCTAQRDTFDSCMAQRRRTFYKELGIAVEELDK